MKDEIITAEYAHLELVDSLRHLSFGVVIIDNDPAEYEYSALRES